MEQPLNKGQRVQRLIELGETPDIAQMKIDKEDARVRQYISHNFDTYTEEEQTEFKSLMNTALRDIAIATAAGFVAMRLGAMAFKPQITKMHFTLRWTLMLGFICLPGYLVFKPKRRYLKQTVQSFTDRHWDEVLEKLRSK